MIAYYSQKSTKKDTVLEHGADKAKSLEKPSIEATGFEPATSTSLM